jgi:hypothetical protein
MTGAVVAEEIRRLLLPTGAVAAGDDVWRDAGPDDDGRRRVMRSLTTTGDDVWRGAQWEAA